MEHMNYILAYKLHMSLIMFTNVCTCMAMSFLHPLSTSLVASGGSAGMLSFICPWYMKHKSWHTFLHSCLDLYTIFSNIRHLSYVIIWRKWQMLVMTDDEWHISEMAILVSKEVSGHQECINWKWNDEF